jgi:hypothetical protein
VNWTRVAIVGTAQSYLKTPWTDPGLTILSLNDAYNLPAFKRADAWYDFHPLDKFFFAKEGEKRVWAHQVPPGYYVRPSTHLEWLKTRAVPVFLHPDYQTQHPDAATWAHAQPFPKAEIEAYFGRYFTSSPAWMIAHAVMQGCQELHIYGIHLATEHEYIEQRPNFEYLIGRVLGTGKLTTTVQHGLRTYQTDHGRVVLPVSSPILASDFQYAFEQRPRAVLEPIKWELHKVQMKRERLIDAFKRQPWWARSLRFEIPPDAPNGPGQVVTLSSRAAQDELWRLDALAMDYQEQMARAANPWKVQAHG